MQPFAERRPLRAAAWRRHAALALLGATVLALTSGCFPAGTATDAPGGDAYSLPGRAAPGSTPTSTSNADGEITYCAGVTISIPDGAGVYRLAGECPEVHINGNDLRVDATNAEVGIVDISGDRNVFDAATLPGVTLHGQDNQVSASDVGSLDVNGDRNVVESAGSIASVAVHGNDNSIVGIVVDPLLEGTGNQVVRPGG